ncbi:transcriptional repressor NrdR [Achromobacter sp. GG226]|uniref:transcriptional regulator NrdR n=1 Tax=Verticiella alkaliphila TaxID=2779529 RepID=UPI001C0BABDD|nr:transcriptional regulator NrdR [Verticiella sp. GG226]MBU4611946.1 transcriptional repressor NrdR [Verticiella sp. GG226]
MKCPFCGHADTQVVETRVPDDGGVIRRRRRCVACDRRFTTYERPEIQMPVVVKRNGARSDYDPDKLRASLALALRKRPVDTVRIDDAAQRIEESLLTSGAREVSSAQIGELVMAELFALDEVAYVRFASVYQSFKDIDAFTAMIRDMRKPAARKGRGGTGAT